MSISDEVQNLETNLTNSYTAVSNKGGTLPQDQCFDNLPTAINTISTAGTVEQLNVTPTTSAQQFVPTGGVDGYNPVNVSAVTSSIDANISASNIKSGVTILGTQGSVVELNGETRSVSLTNSAGQTFTPTSGKNAITSITVTPNNQARTVTPTTSSQSLTVNSGYSGNGTITVNAVTSAIDSNIQASNIKSGVTILGTQGTYTGTTPTLTTKNITQNGTYNASSDNADGYSSVSVNVAGTQPTGTYTITANGTYDVTNYASADVNVSGGGGSTYSYPSVQGNYYVLDDETIVPMCFDSCNVAGTSYNNATFFTTPNGLGIISNLSSLVFARGDLTTSQISNTALNTNGMLGSKTVKHISISFPDSVITRIQFSLNTFNQPSIKNSLQSVRISNMKNLTFSAAFRQCTALTEVDMSTVDSMPLSNALGGSAGNGGAFAYCTSLQTLSFPALKSNSFGSYTNQFNNMLAGVTGCTVHFPSNLQSVIGSWTSVTGGFSGTNTTVLFDLPATT